LEVSAVASRSQQPPAGLTFESTDPQLAARVVNAHIENFREENFPKPVPGDCSSLFLAADQLDELKVKVQRSEDARLDTSEKSDLGT